MKSETMRSTLPGEFLAEVDRICKEGEDISEATERDICASREKIDRLRRFQAQLDLKTSPTAYLYLERLIFCLKVSR